MLLNLGVVPSLLLVILMISTMVGCARKINLHRLKTDAPGKILAKKKLSKESVLLKLSVPFFVLVLLNFLFGCASSFHQPSVSPEETHHLIQTSTPDSEPPVREGKLKDQQQTEYAPTPENRVEASESQPGQKEDEAVAADTVPVEKKIQSVLDEALDFCQVSQDFWQKGELDNALEALDKAYSLILNIETNNISKFDQQKEDLRFLISKRILEIYASRHIVVNGDHHAIPMVMNHHIQAEIDLFTKGREKKFFIASYKRAGKYRPYIVSELKKAGLPAELSWLPLIESGFKVNALSRARALGLWQFIPSTGYKFGLKRDKYIDERIDPVKSTQAAIRYLKELHQIFGDWTTVLAAYNCGEGQVLRVIRTQNINYLDNFWDLYERLPMETARYVPRFMATLHIIKNPEYYGLDAVSVQEPVAYELVTISKQVHLKNVAKHTGIEENVLRELNPELRYRILPKENYSLRVPPEKSRVLLAALDKIPVSYPPQRAYVYHRVRSGESLSTIARRYRTSVRRIVQANNLRSSHFIVAGKKLKIPRRGYVVKQPKQYARAEYESTSNHVVKRGDSLWILANRYGTTTKKIQTLNSLSSTHLYIGQVLKIPERQEERPAREDLKTYMVKQGDSPFQIDQQHKMPLERFLRINRLTPRSTIYPGQTLYIE
jgi:membrane-bound lytic murein transglycosylase D